MTCVALPFSRALQKPYILLTRQSMWLMCLPLLLVACGGLNDGTSRASMGPAQTSSNVPAPEVGKNVTTEDYGAVLLAAVSATHSKDRRSRDPADCDNAADILAAIDSSVNRPIGRRPGDPVGSDEEEAELVGPVRADLRGLMDKYLSDRVRFGSPLAWHGHLPRIACDLGPYQLVEVELTSPFSGAAAADRVWGVLIAPRVGRGYDPNHADCWFARRLSAASGRSTFTSLFHTPVVRRLP